MSKKVKNDNIEGIIENKSKIKIKKRIGKGAFGSVYSILLNNMNYAMKIINHKNENIKKIKNEMKLNLNYKLFYIIRAIEGNMIEYKNEKIYFLIMEKAKFLDLNIFLNNYFFYNLIKVFINTKQFIWINEFPEIAIEFFSYQILKCFEFLNLNSIAHFDIKLSNFLLCENYTIKLSDFSLNKTFKNNEKKKFSLPNGTYNYMGPEYYEENPTVYSDFIQNIDLFSFGCILFYMIYKEFLIKTIKDKNERLIQSKKNDIINFIN